MNTQTFFDNFLLLVDAPNSVPKLREVILRLAVEGKLVSQDPNDEPADKAIRRAKKADLLGAVTQPLFDLPIGWAWLKLAALGKWAIGSGFPTNEQGESDQPLLFCKVSDMNLPGNEKWIVTTRNSIDEETARRIRAKAHPKDTVIFPKIGGAIATNKRRILTRPTAIDNNCLGIVPSEYCSSDWLYLLLSSIDLMQYQSGTSVPALSQGVIGEIVTALPPLKEQRRIVARVDELMRICGEVEVRQQARRESRVRLNNVTLAPLNNAASLVPVEFEQAAERLAENFAALYDSAETVGKLRSTILQLAVQGKLVPQDPQDEAASALVTRIKRLRGDLTDTKIAKVEQMPSIEAGDMSFPIPDGWRWTRLAEICELITKGSSPKWQGISYVKEGEGILFVTSENVGSYRMLFDNRKFVEARFNDIEPRSILRRNDLLMNIVGASIGRAAIFDSDEVANINQAVCLIRVAEPALVPYLLHFFNGELCIQMMFDQQVDNARANLSMGNIAKFPIPVPPLAEQKRIVAKANQLIALCDELEAKLRQAEVDSEKLMNAAVEHVLSSTTEPPILTESSLRPGFSQA